jgi:hypothetical protein
LPLTTGVNSANARESRGSIQTLAFPTILQLNRRRSAGGGLARRPDHSAGGPQGRLAAPQKKREKLSSLASTLSRLQLNDIGVSFI